LPGRLFGALVAMALLADGASRLVSWPAALEAMDRLGYGSTDALARGLSLAIAACSALAAISPTSIVGAILWTGYLGNVLVTHFRLI
jgi:hypothetical protein